MKGNIDFENYDERLERFKSFVSGLDNEDRCHWISAAGKANQLWNGRQEGLEVFNDWSLDANNYKDYSDCEYHYNSLSKNLSVFNKYRGCISSETKALLETKYCEKKTSSIIFSDVDGYVPASSEHPYLKSHCVKSYGLRQNHKWLFIPMYNMKRKLCSFQTIEEDGLKRFAKGSFIKNLFFQLGELGDKVIFCEGYATGAAIHEATKITVIVTFNANNLKAVPKLFRKKLPRTKFFIAADDDYKPGGSCNVGIDAAIKSAKYCRGSILIPKSKDNIRRKQDFCDVLVRDGLSFLTKLLRKQIND